MNESRTSFGSRLGFILVSAGCAIGIGNVWKFPFITGQYGGAVFVLFYLIFLILMGIPVMTMELAVGRGGRASAYVAYKRLEKDGQKWHIHGWLCFIGNAVLMMYYTTVAGWMVDYFYKFLTGTFEDIDSQNIPSVFSDMLASPVEMGIFMVLTVVFGFGVLSFGVQKGLERVTTIMMICLLLLIVVLAVHSLTLPGAAEGLRFYLYPDWNRAMEKGIDKVITSAMNHAFFTLSLGCGSIAIFGSYMSKDTGITGESLHICALDTFVGIMSGLIIFPACFSYGVQPDQGPSLIFITLPQVFMNMPAGRIWGTLFFIFMTFASFSTVTAVFENLVAFLSDTLGWSRRRSIAVNMISLLILSIPCVLGYNVLSGVHIIGGRDILDSEDFIASNIMLPLGALIFTCFCTFKSGWGIDNYIEEVNTGSGIKLPHIFKGYLRFVLPVLIFILLVIGLV